MIVKLLSLFLLVFLFSSCSSTKIVDVDINQRMSDNYSFRPVSYNLPRKDSRSLRRYVRISERRLRRVKRLIARQRTARIERNLNSLLAERKKIQHLVEVDDYYSQVLIYKGNLYEQQLDFETAASYYERVPSNSRVYYKVANARIERMSLDTDKDGFSDALEIQFKSSYNNPLSIP